MVVCGILGLFGLGCLLAALYVLVVDLFICLVVVQGFDFGGLVVLLISVLLGLVVSG